MSRVETSIRLGLTCKTIAWYDQKKHAISKKKKKRKLASLRRGLTLFGTVKIQSSLVTRDSCSERNFVPNGRERLEGLVICDWKEDISREGWEDSSFVPHAAPASIDDQLDVYLEYNYHFYPYFFPFVTMEIPVEILPLRTSYFKFALTKG